MTKKAFTVNEFDRARMEGMLFELAADSGLSDAEWYCLADITNGTMLFDPLTLRCIRMDVEDADRSYFQKWEVDRDEMLSKLSGLDSLSLLGVAIRCLSIFNE